MTSSHPLQALNYTYQHSHCLSSRFSWGGSQILIDWSSRCTLMKPPSTLSRMVVAGQIKALSIFSWLFAEVSIQSISQSLASLRASFLETMRSLRRSHLLPTSTMMTSLLLLFLTSSTHRAQLRKVSLRVISKTTRAAAEERQQDLVMALNYSWPAVSQICSLMVLPLIAMFLEANSTPTVNQWLRSNLFSTKRPITLVLPTPVSPTRMNLKEQSNLPTLIQDINITDYLSNPKTPLIPTRPKSYNLKLITMADSAQYYPPTRQQYQSRVLIFNANGQIGHRLVEYFRNDHLIEVNPNIITGTIVPNEQYSNELGLDQQIEVSERVKLYSSVFDSDIILFPLNRSNTQQLEDLLKYLKCFKSQQKKKLIVISSVFEWRNRNQSPLLKKEDYLQRVSLHTTFEELEHLSLAMNTLNPQITTCLINCGLVYGMGEDVLFPYFKQALEQKEPLKIYGTGNNSIPMIHVDDLAQLTFDLAFGKSSGFFYACDHSSVSQKELVSLISQTIGNGRVEQLRIEQGFLFDQYDILTANIKIEPKSIAQISVWKYKEGMVKSIGAIVGEFNTSRGLKPNKILIHGTPVSGKSKLAEILSKNYGLPILNIKSLIESIKGEESPFAAEIRGIMDDLKAAKIEEERKAYEQLKKKKKGKGMDEFDPSKVVVKLGDNEVCKIVKRRIGMADCLNKGYIIDSVVKSYSQLEAVFLDQKGQLIEAVLPNSVFAVEGSEEEAKDRVKKLGAEITEGTHWNEEQTMRRFGVYQKQNQGKKWSAFFTGKVDIKQVATNFSDSTQFIQFVQRNGPLGFKVKEKKDEEPSQAIAHEEAPAEPNVGKDESDEESEEIQEFNLQKLTQNEVKILNEKSRPIRQYLIDNVIPQITQGLLEICKESPPDPIRFLISFLENKKNKKKKAQRA